MYIVKGNPSDTTTVTAYDVTYPIDANRLAEHLRFGHLLPESGVQVVLRNADTHPISMAEAERLGVILMTIPCVTLWEIATFAGFETDGYAHLLKAMQAQRTDEPLRLVATIEELYPPP